MSPQVKPCLLLALVNRVLSKHGYTHAFKYFPPCFLLQHQVEKLQQILSGLQSLKYLLSWALQLSTTQRSIVKEHSIPTQ